MRGLGQIVAHIPARAGSKRVPAKNLRYLAGKPLLSYVVEAALACPALEQVYVNTDSVEIANLAKELGALVYHRKSKLASDDASSDAFNMDIIEALEPDTLIMLNSVCPLLKPAEITRAIQVFADDDIDTLITTVATGMQCFYEGKAVNVDLDAPLAPTQANQPVHICNWAVSIWDAHRFRERYQQKGFAVFGEKRRLLPIDPIQGSKISTEEDFQLVDQLLRTREKKADGEDTRYWSPEPGV